jgi:hypothetical protein
LLSLGEWSGGAFGLSFFSGSSGEIPVAVLSPEMVKSQQNPPVSVILAADSVVLHQLAPVSVTLQSPVVEVRDLGPWCLGLCSETASVGFSVSRTDGLGLLVGLSSFAKSLQRAASSLSIGCSDLVVFQEGA